MQMVICKKKPFFFPADKKTKVHCYIKWITIPIPEFLLGTDNKGSCLSKKQFLDKLFSDFRFCLQAREIEEFTFLKLEADACQWSIRDLYNNHSKEEMAEAK